MATIETDSQRADSSASRGEPCADCGSPLAADQRYCLNCGTAARRSPGRVRRLPEERRRRSGAAAREPGRLRLADSRVGARLDALRPGGTWWRRSG